MQRLMLCHISANTHQDIYFATHMFLCKIIHQNSDLFVCDEPYAVLASMMYLEERLISLLFVFDWEKKDYIWEA